MMRDQKKYMGAARCAAFFLRYDVFNLARLRLKTRFVCRLGLVLAIGTVSVGQAMAAPCQSNRVVVDTGSGSHAFTVEVADDAQERAQGLMYRTAMDDAAGMLFVYAKPRSVSFWMKNTLIPLDMIFTNQHGVVVFIHENAIPLDETPIFGGEGVFSVLELKAGVSKAKSIEIGDVLLHPAYDFYTSLPCEVK